MPVETIIPLTVVIPLMAAAGLVAAIAISRRLFIDLVSLGVAVCVAVLAALLLRDVGGGLVVYWFGGWPVRDGVAIGISFAIDPVGAALALFVAVMFAMAFVFSFRYFAVVGPLFHVLMLLFLAGAMGFSLTGDLFDLFVFFELVSVSAYALTAYDIEERGPLTGTLNFAVTNSVGAFFILTGIALVYARTGSLNMAQIGDVLAHGSGPDALVVGAFTLMCVGFFCKAAVVPFHFWLADAYAVSPTPVCLLLSAVMSELGLYAFARVYWTIFSGVLGGSGAAITAVLLALGTLTALVGAAMCFAQRHLKRMLAFATVSHVGLFLIGLALLSSAGLAGTAVYVIADGAVKASLFVSVGVIQHRYASVDELALRGRGRDLPLTFGLVVLAGLAVASLPPFGPFLGKSMIEHAATESGHGWVALVFVVASAFTGGAVLRAAGRVFLGWGQADERHDDAFAVSGEEADPEARYPRSEVPLPMTITTVVLLAIGLFVGLVPGMAADALGAAARFVDRAGYAATVLHEAPARAVEVPKWAGLEARDWLIAVLSLTGAAGLAGVALFLGPLDRVVRGGAGRALGGTLNVLRGLHSGHVGDYVTWVVIGTVALGAVWAISLP